jgi:PAS domain S-box-containing protein
MTSERTPAREAGPGPDSARNDRHAHETAAQLAREAAMRRRRILALALAAAFALVLGIGHIWAPAGTDTQALHSLPVTALLVLALLALLWLAYIAVAPARAAIPDVLQHRWRNFFDLTSDWYWEMDADLRFTYFSENLPNITGTDGSRAIGKRREDIIHPSMIAADSWQAHLADIRAHRPFRNFIYAHLRVDGEMRYFKISGQPVFDTRGKFQGYYGDGADITELKRAESRLMAAIEAMSDGFILWDSQDRVVVCNDAIRRMDKDTYLALKPGTRFEDVMRTRVAAGKVPEALGREEVYIQERMEHHSSAAGEPVVQHLATGQWVRIVEHRTRDGDIVAVRSDITALKNHEAELRSAKETAEAANIAKSQFLATMSHELRTPLNAIIGFSEVMMSQARGPLGSPKYVEYTTDINASGHHLLNLINDVLDMSRIETGHYEINPEPIQLSVLLDECIRMIRGRAGEKGVAIEAEMPKGFPMLEADRRALKQILVNLLYNAVKFTPSGGKIAAVARTDDEGGIVVSISDSGIGIAPQRLERIFEPFQTDNAAVNRQEGTGLGLSICKRLMDLHNGAIAIDSTPQVGTTVTCRFPASAAV